MTRLPQTLQGLIASCETKPDTNTDMQTLEEQWNLYTNTGFELKAKELKPKLLIAKARQQLDNPLTIKRPNFTNSIHSPPRFPFQNTHNIGKKRSEKAVFEVEPAIFKGDVPLPILKNTLKAKELGFKPYVWFASSDTELHNSVNQPLMDVDPAIVAYPIISKDPDAEVIDNEIGIVLGIWGKDIEEINTIIKPDATPRTNPAALTEQ